MYRLLSILALGTLTQSVLAAPSPAPIAEDDISERAATKCTDGVVVYGVRGSSKNPTTSADPSFYTVLPPEFTQIANAAIKKAGGGFLQPIAYPASNPNVTGNYGPSVNDGIQSLQNTVADYVKNCKNGEIVLLGYSQGAQVVSSALVGTSDFAPLQNAKRITAGALFADPTYQDGADPLDQGSGETTKPGGRVPEPAGRYDNLNTMYGDRLRSYCQAGDKFCDTGNGPDAMNIHLDAPSHFEPDAQKFITGKV